MRRPGFLGEANYWFGNVVRPTYPRRRFGDACWVCEGNRCKNVCTKAEQLSKAKKKHKKMHAIAAKQPKRTIKAGLDEAKFKLIPGEPQNARLSRLKKMGLYTPGGFMSKDYANLVHFGTRDAAKIRHIKAGRSRATAARNLKRYGTTNVKEIAAIVESKQKARNAMWLRVYGTDDADKIFALADKRRKALCEADTECVRIRKEEDAFK